MNEAQPCVDVVIVNWNTGSYLRECLNALASSSQTQFSFGSVVVVDNGSHDDSLDQLPTLPSPVRIVRNTENRGFAAACNQGATEGNGQYVLFLNPDTRVSKEALDRTIAFMRDRTNDAIGICGGRVVGASGSEEFSCARFPTLGMAVAKMTGLSHVFPGLVPSQRLQAPELQTSRVVDQVIGAYFVTRRGLFEALGGFDERFFVYFEEVDLAYRSLLLGHPSYYLHDAIVYHVGNVSSDQVRGKRLFYSLRGRSEYANKHWPRWQMPLLSFLTLAVELPVRWLVAVRKGRGAVKDVDEAARRYVRYVAIDRRAQDVRRA